MGVIGLGPMGVGLTFNFADNGYTTVVFDPWMVARTTFADKFIDEIDDRVVLVENLESFVESLPTPRRILLMVKAGDPVDVLLEALYPMLSKGDLVCDGGNAHPRDTQPGTLAHGHTGTRAQHAVSLRKVWRSREHLQSAT